MKKIAKDKELERFIRTLIKDTTLTWESKYRLIYDYKSYRNPSAHLGSYLPNIDRDKAAKGMVQFVLAEAQGKCKDVTDEIL